MRKKLVLCALILVCMGIGIAACIFPRPMTAENMFPGVSPKDCTEIQVYYGTSPEADDLSLTLTPEDAAFTDLLKLLCTQKYRRSLRSLFPDVTRTHRWTNGDFYWDISLRFGATPLPDGSVISGTLLHFNDFFGTLIVRFNGADWRCSTNGQKVWRSAVMDTILQAAEEAS